mgnify:CR=1 FL=1
MYLVAPNATLKGGTNMNVNKLKGKIVEKGLTVTEVAEKIDIDRSSLYRKLNNEGETLTIKEANKIVKVLNLPATEATEIFFSNSVAYGANNEVRQ